MEEDRCGGRQVSAGVRISRWHLLMAISRLREGTYKEREGFERRGPWGKKEKKKVIGRVYTGISLLPLSARGTG